MTVRHNKKNMYGAVNKCIIGQDETVRDGIFTVINLITINIKNIHCCILK